MKPSVLRAWPMLGIAVVSFGIASSAQAQDTTRTDTTRARRVTSQQRVPITKRESRGEVDLNRLRADSIARADSMARARMEQMRRDSIAAAERARADSVAAVEKARADSIAAVEKARADSVAAIERARADSIARADSMARAEQMRQDRMRNRYLFNGSGWYIGIGAGTSTPTGTFQDVGYERGLAVTVPIGYHRPEQLLGFRLDLEYNQHDGNTFSTFDNSDPRIFSASLNATARLPLNGSRTFNLYGVGGGGLYMFRNVGQHTALNGLLGENPAATAPNEANINKFGWSVGGGLDFALGPAALFVESRFVRVDVDRNDQFDLDELTGQDYRQVRWVPIILGVTFR